MSSQLHLHHCNTIINFQSIYFVHFQYRCTFSSNANNNQVNDDDEVDSHRYSHSHNNHTHTLQHHYQFIIYSPLYNCITVINLKVASFFNKLHSTFSSESRSATSPKKSPRTQASRPAVLSPRSSPVLQHARVQQNDEQPTSPYQLRNSGEAREAGSSTSSGHGHGRGFLTSSLKSIKRRFSITITSSSDEESTYSSCSSSTASQTDSQSNCSSLKSSSSSIDFETDPGYNDPSSINEESEVVIEDYFTTYSPTETYGLRNSKLKRCPTTLTRFYLLERFPEEVELSIVSHLTAQDLISLSMVNKHFNRLSNDRTLWKKVCKRNEWRSAMKYDPSFEYKEYYFEKRAITAQNCFRWITPKFAGQMPTKRFKHTSTFVNGKIIFIGGQETDTKRFNDIIYYDTANNTFSRPMIKGDRVPNFSRHTSTLVGNSIYIFGGYDGHGTNFDLAVFNTANRTWTNVPKEFVLGAAPVSRTNHASAAVGSTVYIFGGNNNDQFGRYQVLDDLHALNTETMTWEQPEVTGERPCARSGHCMTAIGKKLYVFGGGIWNETNGWTDKFNDVHVFDTTTRHWTKAMTKGEVQTSTFAISFAVGRYMFIFGGGSKPRHFVTNDIYILDTEMMEWTTPFIAEPRPPARDMGTACVAGGDVYFMGGYAGGAIEYFNKLHFSHKILTNIAIQQSSLCGSGVGNTNSLLLQGNSVM
ncbi:hypothetical protein SAMD00019534_084080 [Acytostelium subglobosum LB1]|uniref:hypothetical protein n=1 Tax=Acytostelium subglobosum LB1 TaxID=1410327 RepID=UPI00064490BE|nr:hypothetical protein SAMD00019534_084080 [Acytostelium subglobosum LB1]GAM25233.1 hypothetical protein SAMD00019534_084080 [Acytostelium subglobosum LB1]|eukprot:XP_012751753.1 hypothetical protein SAMD00019534_084080 [Acytostelium subglobosum LB1]